jgi:hypothetical protein
LGELGGGVARAAAGFEHALGAGPQHAPDEPVDWCLRLDQPEAIVVGMDAVVGGLDLRRPDVGTGGLGADSEEGRQGVVAGQVAGAGGQGLVGGEQVLGSDLFLLGLRIGHEPRLSCPPLRVAAPRSEARLMGRREQAGEGFADAGGAGFGEATSHAFEDRAKRFAGEVAEGQGHEVARTDVAAAVDVEVGEAGAAAEGGGGFEVGEAGEDGEGGVAGHLGLVIEDLAVFGGGEEDLGVAGQPAGGAGFEQVDLAGAGLGREAQEGQETVPGQELASGDRDDVGVQAGVARDREGEQGGLERAGPTAEAVVLGLDMGVQADAHGEETLAFELPGPLGGQTLAGGAEDEAGTRVERADDRLEVVAKQGFAAGERAPRDCRSMARSRRVWPGRSCWRRPAL